MQSSPWARKTGSKEEDEVPQGFAPTTAARTGRSLPAKLVGLLLRKSARWIVSIIVLLGMGFGAQAYATFKDNMSSEIKPPDWSPSGKAKILYENYFMPPDVQLIVMISSLNGEALLNTSAHVGPAHWKNVSEYLDTPLTPAAKKAAGGVRDATAASLGDNCRYNFTSFWDLFGDDIPPLVQKYAQVAAQSFEKKLFNFCQPGDQNCVNGSSTLALVALHQCHGRHLSNTCVSQKKKWCDPIAKLGIDLQDYVNDREADGIKLQVVSNADIFVSAQAGVDKTMTLSAMSAPFAFILLGIMLRNLRQLIITLLNILGCLMFSSLAMAHISESWQVSSQSPALMVTVALAMSIDYSLFLLTRFNAEIRAGQSVPIAVQTMLETSGHTVLISGTTLFLCFLGMLLLPVQSIASLGIAAASTVLFAIPFALIFTPTLLLAWPAFFTAYRRFGFTCDGLSMVQCCGCGSSTGVSSRHVNLAGGADALTPVRSPGIFGLSARESDDNMSRDNTAWSADRVTRPGRTGQIQQAAGLSSAGGIGASGAYPLLAADTHTTRPGTWARLGGCLQSPWRAALLLVCLCGVAVPFMLPLTRMQKVEGVLPLMPRGATTTNSFNSLLSAFGVSSLFPSTLILVPPHADATNDTAWLNATCIALQRVAVEVDSRLGQEGCTFEGEPCGMSALDFAGSMIVHGSCVAELLEVLAVKIPIPALGDKLLAYLVGMYGHGSVEATTVTVTTKMDPFSPAGQQWIRALREAISRVHSVDGVEVGGLYLSGGAEEQMDSSQETFDALPMVVGVTLVIVCIVLLLAFRSLFVPIRAVLCLLWMLVVTFGSAVYIYQDGTLSSTGWQAMEPSGGAIFWMSPCIAFSVVVGLGLDYDIFFMESVVEFYDKGFSGKQAVTKALEQTGNTICVAGIIMFLAFGALVVGTTPSLNQIGYLLCVSVLLDCFVTTKLIIPAAMALVPDRVIFWPRKPDRMQQ